MKALGIHHAQVMIPSGGEAAARSFYAGLLGLPEIAKPPALAVRGGLWLEVGGQQLHIGVEEPGVDRKQTRAHVAYLVEDLDGFRARLYAAGVSVKQGEPVDGLDRIECRDPFGNRVELLSRPLQASSI